jgi:hypothetical protein
MPDDPDASTCWPQSREQRAAVRLTSTPTSHVARRSHERNKTARLPSGCPAWTAGRGPQLRVPSPASTVNWQSDRAQVRVLETQGVGGSWFGSGPLALWRRPARPRAERTSRRGRFARGQNCGLRVRDTARLPPCVCLPSDLMHHFHAGRLFGHSATPPVGASCRMSSLDQKMHSGQ